MSKSRAKKFADVDLNETLLGSVIGYYFQKPISSYRIPDETAKAGFVCCSFADSQMPEEDAHPTAGGAHPTAEEEDDDDEEEEEEDDDEEGSQVIRRYQKSHELLLRKPPFSRTVREIGGLL